MSEASGQESWNYRGDIPLCIFLVCVGGKLLILFCWWKVWGEKAPCISTMFSTSFKSFGLCDWEEGMGVLLKHYSFRVVSRIIFFFFLKKRLRPVDPFFCFFFVYVL